MTRHFEHQETLLSREDFQALFCCLAEYDGLGFYNGGTVAGASQPHKHLQLVPLPLGQCGPAIPIEPLIRTAVTAADGGRIPGLGFTHFWTPLPGPVAAGAAELAFGSYLRLLEAAGAEPRHVNGELRPPSAYNLLLTRQWMLLVPRKSECVEGVSVNALGFAGSFSVRNQQELETLRAYGLMRALQAAAG